MSSSIGWVIEVQADELIGPFDDEFEAEDWVNDHLSPYNRVRRKVKLIRVIDPLDSPADPEIKWV